MRTGSFLYSPAVDSLESSAHACMPGGLFNLWSSKRRPSTKTTRNGLRDIEKRAQYSETNTLTSSRTVLNAMIAMHVHGQL